MGIKAYLLTVATCALETDSWKLTKLRVYFIRPAPIEYPRSKSTAFYRTPLRSVLSVVFLKLLLPPELITIRHVDIGLYSATALNFHLSRIFTLQITSWPLIYLHSILNPRILCHITHSAECLGLILRATLCSETIYSHRCGLLYIYAVIFGGMYPIPLGALDLSPVQFSTPESVPTIDVI